MLEDTARAEPATDRNTAPRPAGVVSFNFSTEALPERERVAAWQETFGRRIVKAEFTALGDGPVRVAANIVALPGLGVVNATSTTSGFVGKRTRELISGGEDDIILTMVTDGGFAAVQFGRESESESGEGFAVASAEVGHVAGSGTSAFVAVSIPRRALAPFVRDLDASLVRRLPADCEALSLLRNHLAFLQNAPALRSPELQRLYVAHVYDLAALALGATRDAAEAAGARGLAAARLRAIKTDILDNLHEPGLTVSAVAKRQRVTPRYVQLLFETEGTSFSQFVRDQRLARAHRMLRSPRHAHAPIGTIAYEVGFGDLSNFNHAFRRAFGTTPSDVRAAAREDNGGAHA